MMVTPSAFIAQFLLVIHLCLTSHAITELHKNLSQLTEANYSRQKIPTSPIPIQFGPATPPPEFYGLKGYRRYHANDTLIGWPIPCEREEKLCFKYNLLYDPKTRRCVPLDFNPGCGTRINREEFEREYGHVFADSGKNCEFCPGYRMAFDGKCYPAKTARDVFCACDSYPLTSHFFGGAECRCWYPKPINVVQPSEEGLCVIPDLRFPRADSKSLPGNQGEVSQRFNCSEDQLQCFSNGQVYIPRRGCSSLFSEESCPNDHFVVLSSTEAQVGRAEGVCVHVRGGCPPGQRRLVHDRACHDEADVDMVWTPHWNVYGEPTISNNDIRIRLILKSIIKLQVDGTNCIVNTEYRRVEDAVFDPRITEVVEESDTKLEENADVELNTKSSEKSSDESMEKSD